MKNETDVALRNLRVGGIYTPIVFGILFLGISPFFNMLDASGELNSKYNDSFGTTQTTGGVLLFLGVNTYIYFKRYTKALKKNLRESNP